MNRFYKNDDEYMLLDGVKKEKIFIFVHGYGSSPLDLLPLARTINNEGYYCSLMLLDGHGKEGRDLIGKGYTIWLDQLQSCINYYKRKYSSIYLIGFSLGASLCLDIVKKNKQEIKGVIGLSTFISLPLNASMVTLKTSGFLGMKMLPRLLQVTNKSTKKEVYYSRTIPYHETKLLLEQTNKISQCIIDKSCKVLLLHSIDDKVSSYDRILKIRSNNKNVKILTLRKLKHFIQFDIPQHLLSDVILDYLFNNDKQQMSKYIKDAYLHSSTEFNHWSGILYKLIVGFFSIFGALVYFSLPDILKDSPSTPYYLTSYSIVNSLFIILASLYFFYTNRLNSYMKHYIEPYLDHIPWVMYRTNKYIGGVESTYLTNLVTIPVMGIPLLISTGSLLYLFVNYTVIYINNSNHSILLVSSFVFALFNYLISLMCMIMLQKYTLRELYYIKIERFNNSSIITKILTLYNNITPGCVQQHATANKKSA